MNRESRLGALAELIPVGAALAGPVASQIGTSTT